MDEAPEEVTEDSVEEAPVEDVAVAEMPVEEDPVEDAPIEETAAAEDPAEASDTGDTGAEVAAEDDAAGDVTEDPAEDVAADGMADEESTETAALEANETEADAEAAPAGDAIDLAALVSAGDPRAGARVWRQCSACHVLDQEQNRVGPHLVDVIGRQKHVIEGFRYSDAMLALDGAWTPENMDAWLENPRDYAPGTSMSFRGLSDAEDRANVIAYMADIQLNGE